MKSIEMREYYGGITDIYTPYFKYNSLDNRGCIDYNRKQTIPDYRAIIDNIHNGKLSFIENGISYHIKTK